MKSKVFWKWSIALLVMAPLLVLVLGTSLWWGNGDGATGTQATGPAAWTTTTLGDGSRATGNFWTDVDLDVDERDPANPFIKGAVTSSHAYAAWIQAGPNFVRVQFSKGVRPGVGC